MKELAAEPHTKHGQNAIKRRDKEEAHALEKARQRGIAKSTQDLIDIAEQKAKEQIEEMKAARLRAEE